MIDVGIPWLMRLGILFDVQINGMPRDLNQFSTVAKSLQRLCLPCVLNEQDGDMYFGEAREVFPIVSLMGRVRVGTDRRVNGGQG